ncbi:sugar porter family MFS transporter [Terriglobus roseus]|uniref:MFS transporter, sugar porter (SP) family n=1 Tax=Terriglobus roseus TaxID=392734 RepID=A0A1G7GSD5_9BACT|nr:sugar porter family MFS transporter [Terriglobus roseus]SDE91062.1 MFS transporter, sugar porter (SP) family [Terriglobus roseus]
MQGPAIHTTESSILVPAARSIYVWVIAIVAALGGLLFGYDWVVIGGAREFYEMYFHLVSPSLIGWVNSCALVGCLIGSLAAGSLAERLGRKPLLLVAAVLFAVSSALTGWSYSLSAFITWRIVGGVAIGLASNVSPLYIAEISPAHLRGRLVSLNQFAIVIGILLAQIVNWRIARPIPAGLSAAQLMTSWNVQYGWRWMFTAVVIPSLVFTVASLVIPESPRWLLTRGRNKEVLETLAKIGGRSYAEAECFNIQTAIKQESAAGPSTWSELLHSSVRRIVFIGIALAVLQQWTGINVLFNYAADVYKSAGYGANDILLNIVITGAINLVFTIIAMLLVDRVGRRWLMLFGCVGIGISHLACSFAYTAHWPAIAILFLTLSAIACYALTLAPVTWVLIAEIFPNRVRSQAVSIAVSALWLASFALTYTFPLLNRALGTGGIFRTYGVICLLGWALVFFFVPETRGRSLEQIEQALARQ